MSKERLREAIERVDDLAEAAQSHLDVKTVEALERTIAAARAYACERCGGKGFVWVGRDGEIVKGLSDYFMQCPDCDEWRRIADGANPS